VDDYAVFPSQPDVGSLSLWVYWHSEQATVGSHYMMDARTLAAGRHLLQSGARNDVYFSSGSAGSDIVKFAVNGGIMPLQFELVRPDEWAHYYFELAATRALGMTLFGRAVDGTGRGTGKLAQVAYWGKKLDTYELLKAATGFDLTGPPGVRTRAHTLPPPAHEI
jgi:hypothetical protein